MAAQTQFEGVRTLRPNGWAEDRAAWSILGEKDLKRFVQNAYDVIYRYELII